VGVKAPASYGLRDMSPLSRGHAAHSKLNAACRCYAKLPNTNQHAGGCRQQATFFASPNESSQRKATPFAALGFPGCSTGQAAAELALRAQTVLADTPDQSARLGGAQGRKQNSNHRWHFVPPTRLHSNSSLKLWALCPLSFAQAVSIRRINSRASEK